MLALLLRASATDPQLAARLRPALRPAIWLLLLAGSQPRGGPAPRGPRAASVRVPRRRLASHPSLAGRRPRG
jgi:hypothetical protein